MSAAERQQTCAVCGAAFLPGERTEIEALLDGEVRYVAVHPGHSTFPPSPAGSAEGEIDPGSVAQAA